MEKTFQLDARETAQMRALESERTQALAVVGALSLDMENARKNLEAFQERQRGFIRQMLFARDVANYENARLQQGQLVVTIPDLVMMPPPESDLRVTRTNGLDSPVKE
jgi:hypothetical protein